MSDLVRCKNCDEVLLPDEDMLCFSCLFKDVGDKLQILIALKKH